MGGWGMRWLNELARLTGGVRVVPVDDETIEGRTGSGRSLS